MLGALIQTSVSCSKENFGPEPKDVYGVLMGDSIRDDNVSGNPQKIFVLQEERLMLSILTSILCL